MSASVHSLRPTQRTSASTDEATQIHTIRLLVASAGNEFMVDIARSFEGGFRALGIDARLAVDEVPRIPSEDKNIDIIVAPHEYCPLLLARRMSKHDVRSALAHTWMLNTEQPGSKWFQSTLSLARWAQGVFDINPAGVKAFEAEGIAASLAPLGYIPTNGPCCDPPKKTIDLVFLGTSTRRREQFFSDYAARFHRYNCRLIFAPIDVPRKTGRGNYVGALELQQLLHSTKILLNVHATRRSYFEWHRALGAFESRCLLVSEHSEACQPLINGQHLILGKLHELPDLCERYLNNAAEWERITANAYQKVTTELTAQESCRGMLRDLAQPAIRRRHSLRRAIGAVRSLYHTTAAYTERVARKTYSSDAAVKAAFVAKRLKASAKWQSRYRQVLRRRSELVARMDALQLLRGASEESPYAIEASPSAANGEPGLSVIVTLFNYGGYIEQCLQSIVTSDTSTIAGGVETVVVDDGSTDDSLEKVRALLRKDDFPLKLASKKHNTGLADARNLGLSLATAPYVFILDADNYVLPHGLAKLYAAICKGNFAAAYGIIAKFESDSGTGRGLVSSWGWDVSALVARPYIDAMAMFRRDVLVQLGGYSTELMRTAWMGYEDYDMWLKLADAGHTCISVPQIVAAYRIHDASMINDTDLFHDRIAAQFRERYRHLIPLADGYPKLFGVRRHQSN